MRGKGSRRKRPTAKRRITPAYAGKRCKRKQSDSRPWDHPRLCGEKSRILSGFPAVEGSPPPMRGKATAPAGTEIPTRITPAYAGKRKNASEAGRQQRDHPRLCGEKVYNINTGKLQPGSPPPMRGKDIAEPETCPQIGITPAYAGKSFATISSEAPFRDHPRLCGEKLPAISLDTYTSGSPPPMRGKAENFPVQSG